MSQPLHPHHAPARVWLVASPPPRLVPATTAAVVAVSDPPLAAWLSPSAWRALVPSASSQPVAAFPASSAVSNATASGNATSALNPQLHQHTRALLPSSPGDTLPSQPTAATFTASEKYVAAPKWPAVRSALSRPIENPAEVE
ncbi:hypothetical protein HK405_000646, partial [Cladochytrium tenue]